jgi:hypothetical protein
MSYNDYLLYKSDFDRYSTEVRTLTNESVKLYSHLISGDKSKDNHLDHIMSIYDGFKESVSPKIISHYSNLRYINKKENLRKNKQSHQTLQELQEKYYAFEKELS